jgi:hypothetical protein
VVAGTTCKIKKKIPAGTTCKKKRKKEEKTSTLTTSYFTPTHPPQSGEKGGGKQLTITNKFVIF